MATGKWFLSQLLLAVVVVTVACDKQRQTKNGYWALQIAAEQGCVYKRRPDINQTKSMQSIEIFQTIKLSS